MEVAFFWFVLSFIVGAAAGRRGRSSGGWAVLSLIISPLLAGLLLIAVGAKRTAAADDAPSPSTHVRCPDCRELIRIDARRCKHCGCSLIPQ